MKIKYLFYLSVICLFMTSCNCCCDNRRPMQTEYVRMPKNFVSTKSNDIFKPLIPKKESEVVKATEEETSGTKTPGARKIKNFDQNDFQNFQNNTTVKKQNRKGAHASARVTVNVNINQ